MLQNPAVASQISLAAQGDGMRPPQVLPHIPQLLASDASLISQPFPAFPSQAALDPARRQGLEDEVQRFVESAIDRRGREQLLFERRQQPARDEAGRAGSRALRAR